MHDLSSPCFCCCCVETQDDRQSPLQRLPRLSRDAPGALPLPHDSASSAQENNGYMKQDNLTVKNFKPHAVSLCISLFTPWAVNTLRFVYFKKDIVLSNTRARTILRASKHAPAVTASV